MGKKIGRKKIISSKFLRIIAFIFVLSLVLLNVSCSNETVWDSTFTTRTTTETPTTTSEPYEYGLTPTEIYDHFKRSVFKLEIKDKGDYVIKEGSAYIIKDDGTFVTNAHLIKDAWYAHGKFDNVTTTFEVESIYFFDEQADIAIGKLDIPDNFMVNPVTFSDIYSPGDKVYSIGYPNDVNSAMVTSGKIISIAFYSGLSQKYYIRTDCYLSHGSSGGILSTADGEVIGLTTASFLDTYGSISSSNYSFWQEKTPDTVLSLSDYFHPSELVKLTPDNIEDFFAVDLSESVYSINRTDNIIKVDYIAKIEPIADIQIPENYNNIYVSMDIVVNYEYTIGSVTETGHKVTEVNYVLGKFVLYEEFEKEVEISLDPDKTVTDISYSYTITYVSGSIIHYE